MYGFLVGRMCFWFLFGGIKESSCFMSGLTLREDKREMVVIRNKVPVTFEASFDIHPLSSFPPTTSLTPPPPYLPVCLILSFRLIFPSIHTQSPALSLSFFF